MPTSWYYHYCWAWSSILKVLKVIGLQISLQYLKKEDMKIFSFFAYSWTSKFLQVGIIVLLLLWPDFTGSPAIFVVTCFLAKPECRNFLSEYCNTIIKQQLCGEGLPLPLLQVDLFQEEQGILQQIILGPSNKPEKACIRPWCK